VVSRQYPPLPLSAVANAAGLCVVSYTPRGSDLQRITQVAGEMDSPGGASCALRRNGAIISPLVPTRFGAGGDPPIWLWPGDVLTVEWVGATPGAVGKVTVIYDLGGD
jgi:hypothetical protein